MKINLKAVERLLLTYLLFFIIKFEMLLRCCFCIIRRVEKNIKFINIKNRLNSNTGVIIC